MTSIAFLVGVPLYINYTLITIVLHLPLVLYFSIFSAVLFVMSRMPSEFHCDYTKFFYSKVNGTSCLIVNDLLLIYLR